MNPTEHDYRAAQEHAPDPEPQGSSAMGFAALASAALPVATFVMIVGASSTVATAFGAALLVLGAILLVIAAGKAMAADDANVRTRRLAERVESLERDFKATHPGVR